jgi:predicted esterase YcpF (UPF0227 family)
MVLFIHGFASSGNCDKCKMIKEYYPDAIIPSLDLVDVDHSLEVLESDLIDVDCIIGASLGGFYAQYLAKKFSKKLVVINPVIDPNLLMHLVDFNKYNESEVISSLQVMIDFNQNHDFSQPVEALFGLDDDVVDCKSNSPFYSDHSCKFYKDDHRLLDSFKHYLCHHDTLLRKSF